MDRRKFTLCTWSSIHKALRKERPPKTDTEKSQTGLNLLVHQRTPQKLSAFVSMYTLAVDMRLTLTGEVRRAWAACSTGCYT